MPNGTPSQPKKYYSDNTLKALQNINAMKQQGASDDDIESYLRSIGAERVNERTGILGAAENLGRGFLQGMSEGVTSTVGAAGFLTRPIGGRALENWAERTAAENAKFYDPLGTSGAAGQMTGRILQEVAQAGLMAAPAAKLVGKVPGVGSTLTRALERGTRLQRAGATAATSAPIDIVQGIKAETPMLLPESTGRLGAIAENVGMSGIAGAVLPATRRVQQPIETRRPQAPGETVIDTRLAPIEPRPTPEMPEGPRAYAVNVAGPPMLEPPRPPALPGAPRQLAAGAVEEVVPPTAAAATVASEAPKYPLSYYSDWIFGSKKNPLAPKEALKLPEGDVVGVAGSPDEWGYLSLIVKQKKGKRSVNAYVDVRPVMTDTGLKLERVDLTDPPPRLDGGYQSGYEKQIAGTGEFIGTPRTAPVPDEKQLKRWRKQEERLNRKALGEEDTDGGRPGFAQAQALTTLAGGGAGATAGALTGTDRETRIAGAIGGGLLGAGLGYAAGGRLARPVTPETRGSTPDLQEINRTINVGERPRTTRPWLSGLERFRTNWVAQTYPMEKAAREAFGKEGEQILVQQIAKAQGSGQAAKQYILDTVAPTIEAARGKLDDVRALLKARRDLDIRLKGGAEKSDIPTDVLERAIRDAEADPAVKNAADAVNQVYRDLLTRRYQAGLLSTESYNRILASEDFYSPLVREFVDDVNATAAAGRGGKKWAIGSSGVRRMDRMAQASAQTADPLEVLMSSVERTFNDVGRQNVQNVFATFADLDRMPELIRRVDGKVTPGASTFTQMRDGRPVQYEVLNKDLYDAIAGQGPRSVGTMYMLGMYSARALRAGVTIRPVFAAMNALRDISMSGIQRPDVQRAIREMATGAVAGGATGAATAEEGERMKGLLRGAGFGAGIGAYARPLAQTMVAMKNIVKDEEVYKNFLRQGGSTEGFYVRNATDAQEFLKRMERDGTIKDIINPGSVWKALTYIGNVSEQSTRLAAYKQLRELGATEAQAVLGAQDRTLRFAQRGKEGAKYADIAAFWNPRVQGMDKLVQMLKNPKTWGMGAAMITAPSIALWNVNKDNPEYWERPVWERNMFWLVPKTGEPDEYGNVGFWRIPKPFEIGLLFASLPERFLDAAAQSGVEMPLLDTGKTAAPTMAEPMTSLKETVGTAVGEATYGLLPIPTVAQVPAQLFLNRDIFRNRPIVSRPDLPAPQQATPESSALARVLAERGISPQKTDFAIRGTFGGLGTDVSNVIDRAVRAAGGSAPEPPETGTAAIPRQLQTRTYSSTEAEVSARERLRRLEGVHRGLLKEEGSNDPERIMRYEEKNRQALDMWAMLGSYKTQLDNIAAERRSIIADQRISQQERKQILGQLRKEADAAAREVLAFKFD